MISTLPGTTANMTEYMKDHLNKHPGVPYSWTEKNTVKMSILPKLIESIQSQSKSQNYLYRN